MNAGSLQTSMVYDSDEDIRELVARCKKALKVGLKQFGENTFFDKGPSEVMDIDDLVRRFKQAGVITSLKAFREVLAIEKYGQRVASAILGELEDWDELWQGNEDFLGEFL